MKFGRIFPPSPDFLNQCEFWLFLSPESSAAARDCCVSSGTLPSKGLDNSEEQIRKLVPPCGNITASSQPNATLVQPSKQRCWLMSEAKTNKAKDNFNGASIKGSKTHRKQGACVWSYAEKQGNSNRGRGYDFLLPKLRRKTSRHKSGSLHHPSELTGNKPCCTLTEFMLTAGWTLILKAYWSPSHHQFKVPPGCPAGKPLSPIFHNATQCHALRSHPALAKPRATEVGEDGLWEVTRNRL